MKVVKAAVSLLLAASLLLTSVFGADIPFVDASDYNEHVIYSGLPKTGTDETLESGVCFAVYPLSSNLQVVNSGGVIKTSFKDGTVLTGSEIVETRFSGYAASPMTHRGLVCYEWKVRFNKALPSKIMLQSYNSSGGWGIVAPIYKGPFAADGTYTIGLVYNTFTGIWYLTLDGLKLNAVNESYPHSGTISTDILAPQLQFTFNNVSASIDILDAKLTYLERSTQLIYEGIPGDGISCTQNGATFIAAPNNYGIAATNSGGEITVCTTDNYKSGDYIKFMLSYPAASKTHSGTVTYEYTVNFSGTQPGAINIESMHTLNDWAFANPISTSIFATGVDYLFTITYDVEAADYALTAKRASDNGIVWSFTGKAAGGALAGLMAPYLQWKPRDTTSQIHVKDVRVYYTGHSYTLCGATLGQSNGDMVANINIYKARSHSASDNGVRLMVCGYSDEGEMTSFTLKKLSLSHGENEIELILNQPIENLSLSRVFLWFDEGLSVISYSFADGQSEIKHSIMNMDYMIENIYLKDATVFMSDSDYMFKDGERKIYPQGSLKPIQQDGIFMLPAALLQNECKISVSFNQSTGAIKVGNRAELTLGSNTMKVSSATYTLQKAPFVLNGELYLPFEELMEKGLGKDAYCDERGMLIFSDGTFPHTDSEYFLKVFDTVDHIYRYMQYENPTGEKMLSDAQTGHPRLILTDEQKDYVNRKISSNDARWLKAKRSAISSADAVISSNRVVSSAPANAEKQGAAAQFAADMKHLSLAYLLTDDTNYAQRTMANLKNAIKWDNLGESTAQLTMGDWAYAVALGIDTFYDYMNETADGRALFEDVKTAVEKLLFENLIAQYKGEGSDCRWVRMTDNFTGVCGGGVMMLLLSLAGEEQLQGEVAYLLENVYKSLQIPLGLFGPDGGWYEGVSYGNYCLTNIADALVAMKNTCGTLYALEKAKGFTEIPDFYLGLSTPNASFNFHDMPPRHENALKSFYVAYLTNDVMRLEALKRHRELSGEEFDIMALMFYDMCITDKGLAVNLDSYPRDHYFKNAGAGGFLSSLTEKNPTFVGFHGGYTGMVHDSLDLGEFIFEAGDVMWACDLGSDYYSLPTYFVIPEGYRHYRKNPQGENCVVINPLKDSSYYGQKVGAEAPLIKYETADNGAMAALDLTNGYERDVSSYIRGYLFSDGRRTLTVRDEITLKQNSEVYWFMHTPADVEIVDNKAVLTKDGKECTLEVACSDASFKLCVMDANLLEGSPGKGEEHLGKSNSHVKKLAVHFASAPKGNLNITVKLIPQSDDFNALPIDGNTPIKSWTLN